MRRPTIAFDADAHVNRQAWSYGLLAIMIRIAGDGWMIVFHISNPDRLSVHVIYRIKNINASHDVIALAFDHYSLNIKQLITIMILL